LKQVNQAINLGEEVDQAMIREQCLRNLKNNINIMQKQQQQQMPAAQSDFSPRPAKNNLKIK
jgi:hypothetical protein